MAPIDIVGMQTAANVLMFGGHENNDEQMLRNAAYVRTHVVGRGLPGLPTGQGYYRCPNPAYHQKDFLAIPDTSQFPEPVTLARPAR